MSELTEHLIDLDTKPFVPDGWSVEKHNKGGQFQWDGAKVKLYLARGQKNGKVIEGNKLRNKLRKELAKKHVFNANLLDYLLAHPHLIPEEWKEKAVFFWGTIYRDRGGGLYVRCLFWSGDGWNRDFGWLDRGWSGGSPAVVDAS